MSDSYYDDVPGNLESIFDAGFAFDNSTLQSGSLSGRDDRSAETGTTGTSDSSDTSDIIMDGRRESGGGRDVWQNLSYIGCKLRKLQED
jgi:hypothetical protein